MYLLKSSKCTDCGLCNEACPISKDPKIMNCRHCKDPPCKDACKYNAFYEASPGIYGIDPNICVGCGECAKACPYDAIVMEDGIAKKCDLCLDCVQACPLSALKVVESEDEKREKENILGWKRLSRGKKVNVYWPSIQEARLVRDILAIYSEAVKVKDVSIEEVIDALVADENIRLDEKQREKIIELVKIETVGLSALTPLIEDDNLEEIAVIGNEPVRIFERGKGWSETNIAFTSMDKVSELANKMASGLDRRLTLQEPRMNATLPDGSRLHAVMPPVSEAPSLTIRKFRKRPFSPRELAELGTVSADVLALIWLLMQGDLNILIAGSTGSGKTTMMNSIMSFIPKNERIILVEETPEVHVFHPHYVRLIVNKSRGITMKDLVEDTLRMRPDRVIVGEVRRFDEVKAWIDTTLAGQGKGSLATFHALSGREVLNRLRSMGVPETDMSALHLMLIMKRWKDKKEGKEVRKVVEVSEVEWNSGKSNYQAKPRILYQYDFGKRKLVKKNKSLLLKKLSDVMEINAKSELKKRSKFIERTSDDLLRAFNQISSMDR